MDYDKTAMPETYDQGRTLGPSQMARLKEFFAVHVSPDTVSDVIDLGCGTGRFSWALAELFDARVLGVEPSEKMLARALAKVDGDQVRFVSGSGEAIPAGDASADVIFLSMVLHHLKDRSSVARECARVLRPGGRVCISTSVTEEIDAYPYVDIFPSIRGIIASKLISREELTDVFGEQGFALTAQETVVHQISPNWSAYAEKMALKADSFVSALPEDEFINGLEDMRARARDATGDEPVTMHVDLFVYTLT